MTKIKSTNNGKKGGMLKGKPHYDKNGNSVGGIKAVVSDAGGKPVELEGGEIIINKEASKKYWRELSKINQSAGNGVAIGPPNGMVDEDPSEEFSDGGKIEFNANKLPNKWILSYAKKIKKDHPEIWKLGGNIFGNEAFNNLSRVAERGYWLDSEEWMYKKWQSYVARHHKDYRIEGVVAMLKWVDKVDKGWPYMKQLIEEKIDKLSKKGWKHKTTKMKDGGPVNTSSENDEERLTVNKYILNRHPKKGDVFQGGKVDGYKVMKIKKLKKHFGIIYEILLLDTKKNTDGQFNRRIVSYSPQTKKIGDFAQSNLTATKGKYYTQWYDIDLDEKMKDGGNLSKTPAPKSDRIKGSDVNKEGSSQSVKSGSTIKFDEQTLTTISNKVKEHNKKYPDKKITIGAAKAVVRRGMGAYSSSHRPTITGGQPNSRSAWGIARLNAFTYKIVHGKSKSGKYTQDDDLIEELGYSVSKYHLGGDMSKHLAPNGKPSNLTHEQWHLVRTPEFKAWFGDWENDPENASKVIDSNGEPMVVWHTTNNQFTVFDNKKSIWQGFYFSPQKNLVALLKKSKTLSFFLNLRNPSFEMFRGMGALKDKQALYLKQLGYDGIMDKTEKWGGVGNENIIEIIAFEPEQIKLADGSNTTFDSANPDIRFEDGGELAKGIKAEHEHSQTISKFKKPGISDLQVETAIAKDHLKEDPNYYSKLQKMEAQKFDGGGLIDISGKEILVGDEGIYGRKKEEVKITKITDKLVYYNDIATNKSKSAYRDQFAKLFINAGASTSSQTAQPQATSTSFQSTLTKIIPALVKNADDLVGKFLINISYQIVYYISHITDNVGSYLLHVEVKASPKEDTIGDNDVLKFTDDEIESIINGKNEDYLLFQEKPTTTSPIPTPLQSIADIPSTDSTTWNAEFKVGDRVKVRYDFSKDLGIGFSEVNYNSPENSFVIKKIVTYDSSKRPENPSGRIYWVDNNGQWEGKDLELLESSDNVIEPTVMTTQGAKPKPQKFDPNLDYAALFNTYLQSNTETSKDITSDLVNRQISVFKTIISQ